MTSWDYEAWPYRADLPQRYGVNRHRYAARGGQVDPERDVQGFIAGGANQGDMARFYFFSLLLDQVLKEGLTGNVAELGVYKGNTATLLAGIARRIGGTAFLFDTFEGFAIEDLQGVDADKHMEFADTSMEAVGALVGGDNVSFVKGYFPESTAQIPNDLPFCIVHIDCDLYLPMKSALEYFYPRLVPGGFIIMHDYNSLHWNGAERAIDEFFADKPESIVPLPDGAGSVVVRRERAPDRKDNWYAQRKRRIAAQGWVGPTAAPGLDELVETGWSELEDWGVWGVGHAHSLTLHLPAGYLHDVQLDLDVQVVLLGEHTSQQVDVWAEGDRLITWFFDPSQNRGVRSVRIPDRLLKRGALTIDLRPRVAVVPRELDPSVHDDRPLGVGLNRVRLRWNVVDEAEVRRVQIQRTVQSQALIGVGQTLGLEPFLLAGWSDIEDWGVWGIGSSHRLTLPSPGTGRSAATYEFVVRAVLLGSRQKQKVDVLAEGVVLTSWLFEPSSNEGIRTVTVPSAHFKRDGVTLEFQPHSVTPPAQIEPGNPDFRELGLGLSTFRLRSEPDSRT